MNEVRLELCEDIVIVGAGGLGRSVKWLIDRINETQKIWNLLGFYEDSNVDLLPGLSPLLGTVKELKMLDRSVAVVVALADPRVRQVVCSLLATNNHLYYPTLMDPSAIVADKATIGRGSVIFALSVILPDTKIDDFVIVNQCCSIGHDTIIGDYSTVYPSATISGFVSIAGSCELGANSCLLQGISIVEGVRIGAGAVVTRSIEEVGATYVGVPARPLILA